MKGWGTTLILLGIGSFILPAMNLQFSLISIFGQGNETVTGVVFIALGGLMMLAGKRNQALAKSRHYLFDHMPSDVREPEIAPSVSVR